MLFALYTDPALLYLSAVLKNNFNLVVFTLDASAIYSVIVYWKYHWSVLLSTVTPVFPKMAGLRLNIDELSQSVEKKIDKLKLVCECIIALENSLSAGGLSPQQQQWRRDILLAVKDLYRLYDTASNTGCKFVEACQLLTEMRSSPATMYAPVPSPRQYGAHQRTQSRNHVPPQRQQTNSRQYGAHQRTQSRNHAPPQRQQSNSCRNQSRNQPNTVFVQYSRAYFWRRISTLVPRNLLPRPRRQQNNRLQNNTPSRPPRLLLLRERRRSNHWHQLVSILRRVLNRRRPQTAPRYSDEYIQLGALLRYCYQQYARACDSIAHRQGSIPRNVLRDIRVIDDRPLYYRLISRLMLVTLS